MNLSVRPPEPLNAKHRIDGFSCGETKLDEWLQRRALANQTSGASRTFVAADEEGRVYGYYALAAGCVSHTQASGAIRRNMPEPIPVIVLGRLAVDLQFQGTRLGGALLRDAVQRARTVAQNAGVRALLAHALNEQAKAFYLHYGFSESPLDAMTVLLKL